MVKYFSQHFDMYDPDSLREYLRDHFRYHTMHSWNNSTSYAQCVKLSRLPFTSAKQRDAAYEMLDVPEVFEDLSQCIRDWEGEHDYAWQVGFNGRSSGYLVLHKGGRNPDGGVYSLPGQSVDQDEDFDSWSLDELQARAEIVSSFDALCDVVLGRFLDYVDNYGVKERIIMVPKTVKILEPKC